MYIIHEYVYICIIILLYVESKVIIVILNEFYQFAYLMSLYTLLLPDTSLCPITI